MLYTPDGVKPSPGKVRATENLEPSKDKKEVHTFLGDGNLHDFIHPQSS